MLWRHVTQTSKPGSDVIRTRTSQSHGTESKINASPRPHDVVMTIKLAKKKREIIRNERKKKHLKVYDNHRAT